MSKKILITTTAFAPENEIGAVRMTKIVKYLVRLGYDITVISPELHEISRIDNSLVVEGINKYTVAQSRWFTKIFLRKRNAMLKKQSASNYISPKKNSSFLKVIKASVFSHLQFVYTLIRNRDWKKCVVHFIKENFTKSEFDIVISSYPSLGGLWTANWVRDNGYASLWLSDFRDPINYEVNSSWLKYKLNTYLQNRILQKTDIATCISRDLFKKFNAKYHFKLKYLPNGFDTEDLNTSIVTSKPGINEPLTFCYVGSLYGGTRELKSFFKVLQELTDSKRLNINNVKLIYAGKEYKEMLKQAAQFNLSSILEDRGSVSRAESIQIQNSSDIIIVVTWNTYKDQGILTGKLFECLLTKKTILGVVNGNVPNSEFKNIIEDVNGGFAIEDASPNFEGDSRELKLFIEEKYDEKKKHGCIRSHYNDKRENFNYLNITRTLVSFFDTDLN